jgi:cytochrome c oxidase subunit I+III
MSLDVGTRQVDEEQFSRLWGTRPGLGGWLGVVNHKQVGKRFVVTALIFFLIGGIQAILMRIQLGTPENTFLDPETYNQIFSMHGITMLFLFAVPIGEGLAIYFGPLMLGARDMPFPRLNAFGYWAYLFGGLFLYASFLVGAAPDGGWFAYVPLTGPDYSPGDNIDFYLLGVTFVEISGTIAAIEIIVLILKFRAPGMAISRMPLFIWGVLVTAIMVVFAFPPLIMGSIMLELDRKIGTQFYNAALGGDPVLWQHIFWWFGHPEVYIISLPTFGVVSMIIPVFARTRIVGYAFVATSAVAIGIISFGTWAHHMFATGIPLLALSFFAAATLVVAVPSAVQVFAWIATLWSGRLVWKAPLLWIMGFFFVFILGGFTGVMFAVVPFTWQATDTYFVVAHFHYVILGSVLFPLVAAVYYWTPKITGRMLNDRAGVIAFWLAFVSFNLTFFPQHYLGLIGMARRIYTWPAGLGWEPHNLVSSIGAYLFAVAIAIVLGDFVWSLFRGPKAGHDPWKANTLEWATSSPPANYNFLNIPTVHGRDPLWDHPLGDAERAPLPVEHPGTAEWTRGRVDPEKPRREMIATTVLDARPQEVVTLPVHSWWPLVLAIALAVLLFGALVDEVAVFIVGALGCVVGTVGWLWSREDDPSKLLEQR